MLVLLKGGEFMKYATEMASGGMMYIPSFITISSGAQVILRLLPQQFERQNVSITNGKDL
jgi:hypothetical protein